MQNVFTLCTHIREGELERKNTEVNNLYAYLNNINYIKFLHNCKGNFLSYLSSALLNLSLLFMCKRNGSLMHVACLLHKAEIFHQLRNCRGQMCILFLSCCTDEEK